MKNDTLLLTMKLFIMYLIAYGLDCLIDMKHNQSIRYLDNIIYAAVGPLVYICIDLISDKD